MSINRYDIPLNDADRLFIRISPGDGRSIRPSGHALTSMNWPLIHHRHEEPPPDETGMVACGIANVGIWSDHRRKRVNCEDCLRLPKES
jgi:hypothetical protein